MDDPALRGRMRARGRAHAAQFTWARAARQLVGVLRAIE